MKKAALQAVELLSFIGGLAFLIPPVLSDKDLQGYRATPALVLGGLLFNVSIGLSWRRGAEHWTSGAVKLIAYLVLIFIAYQRAAIR